MNRIGCTEFQSQVYQLCSQIPEGYFSTYKRIAKVLNSSPRAVGQALRANPFDFTVVPCHRVIESNFFVGGYRGEPARNKMIRSMTKVKKLFKEGLFFDKEGYLKKELQKEKFFENFQLSQSDYIEEL